MGKLEEILGSVQGIVDGMMPLIKKTEPILDEVLGMVGKVREVETATRKAQQTEMVGLISEMTKAGAATEVINHLADLEYRKRESSMLSSLMTTMAPAILDRLGVVIMDRFGNDEDALQGSPFGSPSPVEPSSVAHVVSPTPPPESTAPKETK